MRDLETLLAERRDLQAVIEKAERARRIEAQNELLRQEIISRGLELPERRLVLRDLALPIADAYGITLAELRGPSRQRVYAWPRQHLMWKARRILQPNGENRWSYPAIGRYLGGRDHTTIVHGERAHAKRMSEGVIVVLPVFPAISARDLMQEAA